jgi:hypothetical protein
MANLLSSAFPSEHIFTGVCTSDEDRTKIIGQIHQSPKESTAHLSFLLQPIESDPKNLVFLLEGLIEQAGQWGAKQLVAEIPLDSELFPHFRKAGFSVLAKQQVYKWDAAQDLHENSLGQKTWRIWTCEDVLAMKSLYLTLVPPLIQPIEPMTRREMLGLVHYDERRNLQAYADLAYGPAGVWVLPVIHPQVHEGAADLLLQMVSNLPERNGRPLYIATRSYQPWVDQAMAILPASPAPEQAIMVRYLALRERAESVFSFANLENGKTEPTIPLAPIKNHQD